MSLHNSTNVIWTLEGTIKEGQKGALVLLMKEICEKVQLGEPGTINYGEMS
jgi:hypothetical protein